MSNSSQEDFHCPLPFLAEADYHGGDASLRICQKFANTNVSCCIPCPQWELLYPDDFADTSRIPGYLALVSAILCAFMLLAYAVLPPEMTKRQYLNTSLIVALVLLQLGLCIPVLASPQQCINAITPNDMHNSMVCAWSGALLLFGGSAGTVWVLARVIYMQILVFSDIQPGRVFFWISQLSAWGIAIILTTVCLSISGLSFRFGDYCQVNFYKSSETIWGPLLAIIGIAVVLQTITFIYCLKVYIQSVLDDRASTINSGTDSTPSMDRKQTARAIFKRLKTVLRLQWRSMCIALIVLFDVIYLAAVSIDLDQQVQDVLNDLEIALPWIACIAFKPKNECLSYASELVPNGGTVLAILFLISLNGIAAFFLIGRIQMITGWWTHFRSSKN